MTETEAQIRLHYTLMKITLDGIHILDVNGNILEVNDSFCDMLGYTQEEASKLNIADWNSQYSKQELLARLQNLTGKSARFETVHRRKDGTLINVEISTTGIDIEGQTYFFASSRDVTARKAAEEKVRRLTQIYAALSQCNQAIVRCTSEAELFPKICQDAVNFGGMKMAWVGMIDEGNHLIKPAASYGAGIEYLKEVEISMRDNTPAGLGPAGRSIRENKPIWCQDFQHDPATVAWHERAKKFGWGASASLPLRRKGVVIGALGLYADVANAFDEAAQNLLTEMAMNISFALDNYNREIERNAAEEKIQYLAFYDSLTDLPNRRLLLDRLQQALASCMRSGREGALLFIDLDNFKNINDTLGHDIGDALLQQVAQRLESCIREGDTVARLGGDEFVVMLLDLNEQPIEAAAQTESIGEKILAVLSQPYQFDQHVYRCTSSIGVTLFKDHQQATEELMKQADIAMYQAKKAGRNALRFFDRQMQENISARVSLEGELHNAIEFQQFHLHYQIQVDSSYQPLGAEALIRWIHPVRGMVSPAQFIPLAEETGLILPIGQWVLETACAQLKAWQQVPLASNLVLAVNVSAKQFRQANFVAQVQAALQRHAVNPMLLKLELTEGMLLENIEDTIATMNALNEIGIQFSLDDFGTGYSSLQYLKRLPLDQLKIDQSFVRDIVTDISDIAIVRTIVAMARSMDIAVIAEGVETEEQLQLLINNGCTHYQGYLFGKPVPIEQFEAQLKQD
jgi:diguanylate cyclase (GGDEF)-like protein/PAS domain S-box-containing protein